MSRALIDDAVRAKLQEDNERLRTKLETWMKIAFNHGVDVSEERDQLECLLKDDNSIRESHPEALSMLRVNKYQSLLASRIVRKVQGNIHRDVEEEKLTKVKEDLLDFNMRICVPWIRVAKRENVDIQEEYHVILSAIFSEMSLISEASDFQKEVIFRRQLITRQIATSRIIQKVYRARIDQLAERMKGKDWYDEERQQVVEGIRLEAHQHLPSGTDAEKLIAGCKQIFDVYRTNLGIYDTNPELYHKMADREVFVRSVDERAKRLLKKIGDSTYHRNQIEQIKSAAFQLLEQEGYSDDLRKKVSNGFDLFEEQMSPSISHGCGFNGSTLP